MLASLALIGVLLTAPSYSLIEKDEVKQMPGYEGNMPSKQYSGMLEVPNTGDVQRYYHYWLVQSETEPEDAPVVVTCYTLFVYIRFCADVVSILHSFGSMAVQVRHHFWDISLSKDHSI